MILSFVLFFLIHRSDVRYPGEQKHQHKTTHSACFHRYPNTALLLRYAIIQIEFQKHDPRSAAPDLELEPADDAVAVAPADHRPASGSGLAALQVAGRLGSLRSECSAPAAMSGERQPEAAAEQTPSLERRLPQHPTTECSALAEQLVEQEAVPGTAGWG